MQGLKAIKLNYKFATLALLIILGVLFSVNIANAEKITNRSLTMSDSSAGKNNVTYLVALTRPDNGLIGSLELEICSNDPFPGFPCTIPVGLDFAASSIANQTGITDFTIHTSSTANKLIFTRTPSVEPNGPITITLNNVTNPSSIGSYFVRIRTFISNDATGPATDQGGFAIAITTPLGINTEVPPYLLFCVAKDIPGLSCAAGVGNSVNLGELSFVQANAGYSQMLVGTNAGNGFNISVVGTPPTSGNNVINAINNIDNSQPGKDQFGINLVANSIPNIGQDPAGPGTAIPVANYSNPNFYRFVNGETLVISNTVSNYRKFTVSYLVNRHKNTKPGIYNTVILYVALATF